MFLIFYFIITIVLLLIFIVKDYYKIDNFNNNIEIKNYDKNSKENIRFAFITTSYNTQQFIIKNLDSIRKQLYKNFIIFYVNDCSTDNSLNILNNYKHKYPELNIHLITNSKRMGPAYSRYIAYQNTLDDDICVFLDGDDFLYHNNVLHILYNCYNKYNIYATFGSYDDIRNKEISYNKYNNEMRFNQSMTRSNKNIYYPHLRTAVAKYVKMVPESYLKFNNQEWFLFCSDVALFMPLLELINNKFIYIKNRLMLYNRYNSENNILDGFKAQNNDNKIKRNQYKYYIYSQKKLVSPV